MCPRAQSRRLAPTEVQVGPRYDIPGYIGVDWFILDLLMSTMIFVFLEKLFPHIREQAILRPDWWHDFRYFALNHLLIGIFAFAATMTAPTFFSWAVNHGIQVFVSSLPWTIQFDMAIVLADLVEYAIHRTLHEVKWLWPIHAVHHSVEHMDWLAGSRLHFLEPLVMRALVLIPAFILGIAKEPLTVYIVFAGFQAGLIHANIRWDLGPLKYVLTSPRYHHWHHSSDDEAIDKNYVAHLPVIDWLFGTFYMPKDKQIWPRRYGTVGWRCRRESCGSFSTRSDRIADLTAVANKLPAGAWAAIGHPEPHSITSLARPSNVSGTVNPSALAVLRLMTSSTFTACWTGRSAGLAPL